MKRHQIWKKILSAGVALMLVTSQGPVFTAADLYSDNDTAANDSVFIPSEESETVQFTQGDDILVDDSLTSLAITSASIIVGTDDPTAFEDEKVSVQELAEDIYLLDYPSVDDAQAAYGDYLYRTDFAENNTEFCVADVLPGSISDADTVYYADDQAVTRTGDTKGSVIALIDTGVSENANVIERVSVIGGEIGDDNGHGDSMLSYILAENPDAEVVSVKALNENGTGT